MKSLSAISLTFLLMISACGEGLHTPVEATKKTVTAEKTVCEGKCRIFVTTMTYDGNLGGASGADSKCQSDANKPSGKTKYKALISDSSRVACTTANCTGGAAENVNWVLKANTTYVRVNNSTEIFKTDAKKITDLAMAAGDLTNAVDGSMNEAWTGLDTDTTAWTVDTDTCSNWTSNLNTDSGVYGQSSVDSNLALGAQDDTCDQLRHLYCVEQ